MGTVDADLPATEVERLRALADERAALLRVAELVARAAPPDEIFTAVVAEASVLLDGGPTTLARFEGPEEYVVLASGAVPEAAGQRVPVGPGSTPDRVYRSATVVRVDDYAPEPDGELAAWYGVNAAVVAPVVVAGAVWGYLSVASPSTALPAGTEDRLEPFARLVAVAIANSQVRTDLQALADEQAALRRVAELTARGAPADAVLAAVTVEGSRLFGFDSTTLLRFEADGATEVVAVEGAPHGVAVGMRAAGVGEGAVQQLWRTGRPGRVDDLSAVSGRWPGIAHGAGFAGSVAVPVLLDGALWGALAVVSRHGPLPRAVEDRLVRFAELVGVAIANAEANAQLTASRARVVASADEARRRLQRDVHDGAQQRLVHALIALKMARTAVEAGSTAAALVAEALANVERATRELREIVHGILPASLTRGGLRAGLESLADDLSLPVDLRVTAPRLPAATETTAYFVVAEALTNVVKHAQAGAVAVDVALEGDTLAVEVRDDGRGGADPARGSGLTGLLDRVAAADGVLTLTSPAGAGTVVRAALPVRAGGARGRS